MRAFAYCENLTQIVLPPALTCISSSAFERCARLTDINIPESVTSIGDDAFNGCTALKDLAIPACVTEIGQRAFSGTEWLELKIHEDPCVVVNHMLIDGLACQGDITVPEGVTRICCRAFACDYGLTGVTVPEGVTEIDAQAFWRCDDLKKVRLPESLKSIGDSAFYMCRELTDTEIPAGVTEFGGCAFQNTPWLAAQQKQNPLVILNQIAVDGHACKGNVEIPDGVTGIGASAFDRNTALTGITLPESVTAIGSFAFFGCEALADIVIPETVTAFGRSSFSETAWLDARRSENPLVTVNHILIDGSTCGEEIVIPEDVKEICGSAFEDSRMLRSVTVPEGVIRIGDYAFSGAAALNCITLPVSVTEIGRYYLYLKGKAKIRGYSGSYAERYAAENGIPFESLGTVPAYVTGDFDGDGSVSIEDAQNILNAYTKTLANNDPGLTAAQRKACDVNADGAVDVTDAQFVLNYYVKNTLSDIPAGWDAILGK